MTEFSAHATCSILWRSFTSVKLGRLRGQDIPSRQGQPGGDCRGTWWPHVACSTLCGSNIGPKLPNNRHGSLRSVGTLASVPESRMKQPLERRGWWFRLTAIYRGTSDRASCRRHIVPISKTNNASWEQNKVRGNVTPSSGGRSMLGYVAGWVVSKVFWNTLLRGVGRVYGRSESE